MPFRAVLLDRDGVLNVNRPDHVTDPGQWQWLPGARTACARLAGLGVARFAVVTNQSVVGRGPLTERGLRDIHDRMTADLAAAGAPRPVVLHCPHLPETGCPCRKPRPGMLLQALNRLGVAPAEALLVGDHDTDLEAAAAAGCWSLHVRTGRGALEVLRPGCLGSMADLGAVAELVAGLRTAGWTPDCRRPDAPDPTEGALL
ncbi:D-glycero-alpha-D-manno-heptose-1,7-bisphosphate 7-phosphatase [Streptomyces sp. NPDC056373]|uniref:D-glycero-alpha-D-manno-heptose-1,7-bisphosphate 7-phosphatase n=1 Tax=Streptomyces sp. NPDC056373 TaxID=3345798 RepID=UPI0035D7A74E